ncbi:hypothetical protein SBA3_2590009 [Candidatus Sulfopaludibacter sp. SbA3]|nr:hypothetical protein SBA3_2590009 [Candidatus Sulfopaludibacter sp. SbA3]
MTTLKSVPVNLTNNALSAQMCLLVAERIVTRKLSEVASACCNRLPTPARLGCQRDLDRLPPSRTVDPRVALRWATSRDCQLEMPTDIYGYLALGALAPAWGQLILPSTSATGVIRPS